MKSPRKEVPPTSLHSGGLWVAPPTDTFCNYRTLESVESTMSYQGVTREDPEGRLVDEGLYR